MEKLIIGFSKPKKFKIFAWAIMKGYNIPYDHVYVRIHSDKYDRDLIYQASRMMVNFMSPALLEEENIIVAEFELDITTENKIKLMQFAIDNAGRNYGVKQAIGMAWVRINELCSKIVKNPYKDDGATYVCSELVSFVLEEVSDLKIDKDTDDMTPLDVYNVVKDLKNGSPNA